MWEFQDQVDSDAWPERAVQMEPLIHQSRVSRPFRILWLPLSGLGTLLAFCRWRLSFLSFIVITCMYMVCVCMCLCVGRPEVSFVELVFSFYLCSAREQTQVVRFVPRTLDPLSHLVGPANRSSSSVLEREQTVKASKQNPRRHGSEVFTFCLRRLRPGATVLEALHDYQERSEAC
jgi:hypothetical protein